MKNDLTANRKVISEMLGEVNNFRHGMADMVEAQKKIIDDHSNQVIMSAQNNIMFEVGHMAHDLNMCKTRYDFSCKKPVTLVYLENDQSIVSSADKSADLIKIKADKGVEVVENLNTEGNEVYAACLLFGNQHGVSLKPIEEPEVKTLFLGCKRGNVYKYEKGEDDKEWKKTGHIKVSKKVDDILQVKDDQVLLCQDQGTYDFVATSNMNVLSHNEVEGIQASCKTRFLQRGGQLAIADASGLRFLEQHAGIGRATNLKLLDERFLKGKEVTDFIEYLRDKFLVTCLSDTHFYIISRSEKKTTTIISLNSGYITMGIQMMPGYESHYAFVRDTRGIQLLDLVTLKSHQIFLGECSTKFSDLRFLQVLYSDETESYTFVTMHKDKVLDIDNQKEVVPVKKQLCIYTLPTSFT